MSKFVSDLIKCLIQPFLLLLLRIRKQLMLTTTSLM